MCCLRVEVTMPIVTSFAMAFCLRKGCFMILGFVAMRTTFFFLFAVIAILETMVLQPTNIPHLLIDGEQPKLGSGYVYFLFCTYETFLISQVFMLLFCLHLVLGLVYAGHKYALKHFEYYLLCHVFTWFINVLCLLLLNLYHTVLLAWYLGFAMIIILEIYFIVVVYSYYVCLVMEDEEKRLKQRSCFSNQEVDASEMEIFWPRVNNFLCCIPLKTGTLVIGYASVVISISFISSISWSLYKVVSFVSSHRNVRVDGHSPEEVAKMAVNLYISHGYFLLVMLYSLVINLILIVASHVVRSKLNILFFCEYIPLLGMKLNLLRLYIYAGVVSMALTFGLVVVTGIFFGLYISVPVIIYCGLLFYCLITVRSTYLEIVEQLERKDYEMQNVSQQQALMRNAMYDNTNQHE